MTDLDWDALIERQRRLLSPDDRGMINAAHDVPTQLDRPISAHVCPMCRKVSLEQNVCKAHREWVGMTPMVFAPALTTEPEAYSELGGVPAVGHIWESRGRGERVRIDALVPRDVYGEETHLWVCYSWLDEKAPDGVRSTGSLSLGHFVERMVDIGERDETVVGAARHAEASSRSAATRATGVARRLPQAREADVRV